MVQKRGSGFNEEEKRDARDLILVWVGILISPGIQALLEVMKAVFFPVLTRREPRSSLTPQPR